jgi:mycothiol synthase
LIEHAADRVADVDRSAAAALVQAVAEADGTGPLSEDGRLALANGRSGSDHFVWRAGDTSSTNIVSIVGYLYLSPADEHADRTAELCVAPGSRRRGIASALLDAALRKTAGTLSVWAHGSLPGTPELARKTGFTAVRDLRLMELSTTTDEGESRDLEPPPTPAGIALGTFRPGEDEAEWLALNARAFAHHPEQGRWTRRDLDEREAEPWFDPAGFFLARESRGAVDAADGASNELANSPSKTNGRMLGFHWTKVQPAGAYGPDPVGEVYVLGVDPAAGGHGLGRILTLVGLQHMAQSGLQSVILYVDGDNVRAVRLYESLGFHSRTEDTLYERRGLG